MKKTLMFSLAAATMLANNAMAASVEDRVASLEKALEKQKEINSELNMRTAGNHLKFDVDYRFSVDNVRYEMADGSKQGNSDLYRNRLWVNMGYKYNENLSFTGQIAYNKTFGQRFINPMNAGFEGFDWVSNETAFDDQIRVRQAYFFLMDDELFGADIPWTFSIGRRPSTNGYLANLRENDRPASPMGHVINVEFDGASAKFGLEGLTSVPGAYLKFCYGRGATNADAALGVATPYDTTNLGGLQDIDMGGFIFVPYDDGQYSVHSLYSYSNDLIGLYDMQNPASGMVATGDMAHATVNFKADGIGDGISDFLDDTTFFASYAWSKTMPQSDNNGQADYRFETYMMDMMMGQNNFGTATPGTMLGSDEDKLGNSFWAGVLFPSMLTEGGKWGIEYNQGSKWWKPVTYGEDTIAGSKLATRGKAFEVYMTENLIDDAFTFQLRYTMMDYDYSGSNGFFGMSGMPMKISDVKKYADMGDPLATQFSGMIVDKATNIRAYLRYRF